MSVQCISCGAENREGAKFCKVCGKPMMPTGTVICPRCQRANVPGASRCAYCSNPLSPPPPMPAPVRAVGQLAENVSLVGRYTVTRLIGIGGMSAVYEGYDARLGNRRVAIKEMSLAASDPVEQQQMSTQFKQEAEMLAHLNHANLPRVTDYFLETGKHYLVMDFVEGQSLHKVLEANRNPLPESQVVPWLAQLCDVLDYLHLRQPPVIFRDLKPSNIMLEPDGRIKLIDFGIARVYKPGQSHDTSSFGTSGFAPPEQYGKGQTDARSDIYALCVTAYNLLTNYDPARTPFSLPSLRQLNPAVSPHLAQVLTKGMALDPNERWRSMSELRKELVPARGQGPMVRAPAAVVPAPTMIAPPERLGATKPAVPAMATRPAAPPTTRLLMAMAQLSTGQLVAALIVFLILVLVFSVWLVPVLVQIPGFWNNVDGLAVVAPLAYAMARRRGATFIAHTSVALIGGVTVWQAVGVREASLLTLVAAAVVSGILVEVWVMPLRHWAPKGKPEKWLVELLWLMLMAPLAIALLHTVAFGPRYAFFFGLWITSAFIGALGWFVGDLLQQSLAMRNKR